LLIPLVLLGAARADDRGLPVVRTWTAEDYHGGAQNWGMAQDARGVLYVANLHGVIVYDGAWWRTVPLPNESAAFAVATDEKDRVLTGGNNELGWLERDPIRGTTTYHSLTPMIRGGGNALGDVVSICRADRGFAITTDRAIFTWDSGAPRFIAPVAGETARCLRINGATWIAGNGVRRIDGTRVAALDGRTIDALVSGGGARMIAMVRGEGLVAIDGAQVTPFAPAASATLRNRSVTDAVRLPDGRIAITTREDGAAIVMPDGTLDQLIDASTADVLRAAYVDRDAALWLIGDSRLAQVAMSTGVTVWDARRGLKAAAQNVIRWNGRLYAATGQGLYVLDPAGVRRVEAIGNVAVWHLLPVDDGALVATGVGVFHLTPDGGAATRIAGTENGAYELLRPSFDRSRVWLVSRIGIGWLRLDRGAWRFGAMLAGAPRHARELIENGGAIWCGTTFDGVVRIDGERVTRIGSGEVHAQHFNGRVLVVRHPGELLRVEGDRLVPDPELASLRLPQEFFDAVQDSLGNLWINSMPPREYRPGAVEGEPLVDIDGSTVQSMIADAGGVMWFGTDRGLFRYVPSGTHAVQPAPMISRVDFRRDRRMRVEFAPLTYRRGVVYQYRLDPADSDWSAWTGEPFIDFTNLSGGNYTFRLRARGAGTAVSPETQWSFTVQPPWYETRAAKVLWVLLAIALVVVIVRIRTATLHMQADRLRARIAESTAELHEKNELLEQANARLERLSLVDELTGLANRRYFQRALDEEWTRAARDGKPLALIMIDLDHFKELNDARGHPAGDECLRQIGAYFGSLIRRTGDVVARYGGEELAVLLIGTPEEGAVQVAERLRTGIASLLIPLDEERTHTLTASFGVAALIPEPRERAEVLVETADRALYAAKQGGRNCVKSADPLTSSAPAANQT
jgi:diguanylate cyclase (GGDEF)-like protein